MINAYSAGVLYPRESKREGERVRKRERITGELVHGITHAD